MASSTLRRVENVAGDFFVDESCIDCDTCRWMAPETFDRAGDMSRVHRQPATEGDRRRALMALVACPTSSIGTEEKHDMRAVTAALPDPVAENVYHCGYHSEQSFGAASYLIVREAGNVLVDVPRFARPLVRRIEELGGVSTIFLTHRDDVFGHGRWAAHFAAERILHEQEGELEGIERRIEGRAPVALDDELEVLPTPGHTRGSCCLLYRDRYLFSGDHLAWSARLGHLYAFKNACWYDWDVLRESMRTLASRRFEWVLPGHGRRCHLPQTEMRADLERCLTWMGGVRPGR
jgi:glyoxylase-like metal-dependent hydrolase (beta-lactamase superfamily II)/ferredoxin